MNSSKIDNTENTTKDEKQTKRSRRNGQDRRQLDEIYHFAFVQAKTWFVLSVIAAIVVFSFGMVTTTAAAAALGQASPDFNPVSLIVTIATGMIETVFLVQLRGANKRLDDIRKMLMGGK